MKKIGVLIMCAVMLSMSIVPAAYAKTGAEKRATTMYKQLRNNKTSKNFAIASVAVAKVESYVNPRLDRDQCHGMLGWNNAQFKALKRFAKNNGYSTWKNVSCQSNFYVHRFSRSKYYKIANKKSIKSAYKIIYKHYIYPSDSDYKKALRKMNSAIKWAKKAIK